MEPVFHKTDVNLLTLTGDLPLIYRNSGSGSIRISEMYDLDSLAIVIRMTLFERKLSGKKCKENN